MAKKAVQEFTWGIGRRKSSIARVRLMRGTGRIIINKRPFEDFFPREQDRVDVLAPLKITRTANKYNIIAGIKGGGQTGQAGALSLGISRALVKVEPGLEETLRDNGLLTRDPRMKERKKYGQRGARAKFQFSKR
jgi:small subunit ribosomal protein S9